MINSQELEPSARRPDAGADLAEVDLIVPVYGGLRHVRSCLTAVSRWSDPASVRLIVVDDASPPPTSEALGELVAEVWPGRSTVLRNEVNEGFLRTANRGMRTGCASIVVLLNSDALVTPGWLDGLISCLRSAEDVGICSPLSNHANLTRIRAFYGVDHLTVARAVRRVSSRAYPEIHFASGFCLAARREVLDELDFFDERYGRGYFEETDLCLRAAEIGWRSLADDATYVHHHGWGSFGEDERDESMADNLQLFEGRWGQGSHDELRREVIGRELYVGLERRLAMVLASDAQVTPRRSLSQRGSRDVARKARVESSRSEPTQRFPTADRYPVPKWRHIAARPGGPVPAGARDVLVIAEELAVDPLGTDLLRIVDLLAESGLSISLATTGRFDPALYADPCRLRPFVLSGPDELVAEVPPHQVVVATGPSAVYDALLLRERDGSTVAGWFDPQATTTTLGWPDEGRLLAIAETLVAAHFGPAGCDLADLDSVSEDGSPSPVDVHDVPLSVCLDTYHAGAREPDVATVLVPHDLRGGIAATLDAQRLTRLLMEQGIDVLVYGDPLPEGEVRTEQFASQAVESQLLRSAVAVVEAGPIPGLDRFRLRCAASGAALVMAGPVGRTCVLEPETQTFVAPRGDVRRAAAIATRIIANPAGVSERVAAARRHAASRGSRREVQGFLEAVRAITKAGSGSHLADPSDGELVALPRGSGTGARESDLA